MRIQNLSTNLINSISSATLRRKYFLGLVLLSCYSIFFSACKDPDELGLEVQPKSDQFAVIKTDSVSLITWTAREDSLYSKGVIYQLLGSYTDPVFGRSDASFYTQVSLGLSPTLGNSGDVLVPDSLILSLRYAGYYGDTTTTTVAHVYRVTEDILSDTSYFTSSSFAFDPTDLANNFSFSPMPNGSSRVDTINQPAQLRIPLSMVLADSLVLLNGQSAFASSANWLSYFKGLYVKTDPENISGKGAISYFDLTSAYTKLTLYYHNTTTGKDSLHYDFDLSSGLRTSHQEHEYNGAATDVGHQLIDSTFNDSLNYVQSMGGVKTKILFPYLKHFLDSGNIIVNKAELQITVQSGSTDKFAQPAKLFLTTLDSIGRPGFLQDYFEGVSYFGGDYNSTDRTYKFNISRHLQRILDGKINDYGLALVVSGAVVQANRVVIGSAKNQHYPMKLHVFYTRLH